MSAIERNIYMNWTEMPRNDLNMIPTMESLGLSIVFSPADKRHNRTTPQDCPHDSVGFELGQLRVWYNCYRTCGWIFARLVNNAYTDHQKFDSLEELIEKRKLKLIRLWQEFGDIPVNEDPNETIDEDFDQWKKGTAKYDIWRWFDEQWPYGTGDLMEG